MKNKTRVQYFVKRPGKVRRSYSIIRRTCHPGTKARHEVVQHDALDALNRLHSEGRTDQILVEKHLKELLERLKKADPLTTPHAPISSENLNILDNFWKEHFAWRSYVDKQSQASAYNDYRRAIEALGEVGLVSASEGDLQRAIAKYPQRKRRRLAAKIKQIALSIGRKLKMQLPQKVRSHVKHLTHEEVLLVVEQLSQEMALFYQTLFWTGCRIGEAEYLRAEHFKQTFVKVEGQITELREVRPTKRGQERAAFIPPAGRAIVKEWCAVAPEIKARIRKKRHRSILTYACEKNFPGQPLKHCTPHCLRHSYAINLLRDGHPIERVAGALGDTIPVVQEHYAGYTLSDSLLDSMESVYNKPK